VRSLLGRWVAWIRGEHGSRQTGFLSSDLSTSDLESYYLRIIQDVLGRLLVRSDSLEITVRPAGHGPDGIVAFAGHVRILRWDPVMPVLLQNLPVIDGRVRKMVKASVLLENTRFAGLWFHAAQDTPGAPETLVGMPTELVWQQGR